MSFAIWAIIIGVLLTTMALSGSLLKRLPLSTAMLYLLAGVALGPVGWASLQVRRCVPYCKSEISLVGGTDKVREE